MDVYLDHNVIIRLMKGGTPLSETVLHLKNAGARILYSPAHIEEVAVILRENSDLKEAARLIHEHLEFISYLTGDWEYLPAWKAPIQVLKEKPLECFKRVVDFYPQTLEAEELSRFSMSFRSASSAEQVLREFGVQGLVGNNTPLHEKFRVRHGIDPGATGNIQPHQLFEAPRILMAFEDFLSQHALSVGTIPRHTSSIDSHTERESSISLTLKFLDQIGYRADKPEQYRSYMHDVSHAVYGSVADYFVTGDTRYLLRLRAAYAFLQIPAKVLSLDEHQHLLDNL
jgi:hypothetical protein